MKAPIPIASLFAFFALVGCGGGVTAGDPTGAVCPTDSTFTYDNFGHDFVQSYCTSCHSKFDTQDGVQANADLMDTYSAAGPNATNTAMPEGGNKPSLEERQALAEWLACGAP